MSTSKKARVRKELEVSFNSDIIKENEAGFKINIHSMDDFQIITLSNVSVDLASDVSIKRSGTGLVVLIDI